MKNPIRFVSLESDGDRYDSFLFEKMASKIAHEARISPTIVKEYSKRAIKEWEKKTGQIFTNLVKMSSLDRSENVYHILSDLRHSLEPYVPSVKTLDKSMSIASVSIEIMLNPSY